MGTIPVQCRYIEYVPTFNFSIFRHKGSRSDKHANLAYPPPPKKEKAKKKNPSNYGCILTTLVLLLFLLGVGLELGSHLTLERYVW